MNTGLFLITSNAETAEKLKNNGYQLAAVNGGSFIFIDNMVEYLKVSGEYYV